ncbi:hypothetical protein F511_35559 [Dorcoceras hygrometricum]|uniref:Uncharacterized protein n=1 Tax=Dorcoceras hygrometricum TaxID=472368 RepID=A0A2Z7DB89_9LAMI|nr:hypothetical protein F511_35559 [Dorcoceras hygrometricum]
MVFGRCVKEAPISCKDDDDKVTQFLNLPVKKLESDKAQRHDIAGKNTTGERLCLGGASISF